MNLYSNDVPAGIVTEAVQTGYDAADSAICEGGVIMHPVSCCDVVRVSRKLLTALVGSQFPSCAMLPTTKMFYPFIKFLRKTQEILSTHLAECSCGRLSEIYDDIARAAAVPGTGAQGPCVDGNRIAS